MKKVFLFLMIAIVLCGIGIFTIDYFKDNNKDNNKTVEETLTPEETLIANGYIVDGIGYVKKSDGAEEKIVFNEDEYSYFEYCKDDKDNCIKIYWDQNIAKKHYCSYDLEKKTLKTTQNCTNDDIKELENFDTFFATVLKNAGITKDELNTLKEEKRNQQ